jgi:hypothetical protein
LPECSFFLNFQDENGGEAVQSAAAAAAAKLEKRVTMVAW